MIGFGVTVAAAKKQDPTYFNKGMMPTKELQETGANLAMRALGWGTLYAVTGCGILFYSIWKLSGAKDVSSKSKHDVNKLVNIRYYSSKIGDAFDKRSANKVY